MLEEQDLVISHDDAGKKVFTLTDAGRSEAEKVELGKERWNLAHGDHENIRDMVGAMHELKHLMRQIAMAEPAKRDQAREIIGSARDQLQTLLDKTETSDGK